MPTHDVGTTKDLISKNCFSLRSQIVKEAIAAGVDGYDADIKQAVRKAARGLRLSRELAMSIASIAVSISYIFLCSFSSL